MNSFEVMIFFCKLYLPFTMGYAVLLEILFTKQGMHKDYKFIWHSAYAIGVCIGVLFLPTQYDWSLQWFLQGKNVILHNYLWNTIFALALAPIGLAWGYYWGKRLQPKYLFA